jgi:MFS family permease
LALYHGASGAWVVGLTVLAIVIYAFTLAPVTWVLLAELFPNRVRGLAMSIAVTALWVGNFTLSFSFPVLNRGLASSALGVSWRGLGPHGSFWLYGVVCAAGFVVLLITLRETRGRTLEQIESDLLSPRSS